jgi:thioredoxin reductase (NADPH)
VVAVCGGGDAGISEAIYLTNLASKVILIENQPLLTGTAILQERAHANSKLEIRCGEQVVEISGDDHVQAVHVMDVATGVRQIIHVDGVLIHVGIEPLTGYLKGFLTLDGQGQILVNDRLETTVAGVLAAGDIRCGSVRQVAAAVGDGAIVAIAAERLLSTGRYSLSRC